PLSRPGRESLPFNRGLPMAYRLVRETLSEPAAQGPLARDARLAAIEAALFAADEPLTPRRLAQVAELSDVGEPRRLSRQLRPWYVEGGSAFHLEEIAGGYQLLTRPEFHPWLARLRRAGNELRLSGPARETLAIVAYRQPIGRADIEAIRGVQC